MIWTPSHPAFQSLLTALSHETAPVYVVGGAVRDHLMRRATLQTDLDVVVEHSALRVARRVADKLGWAFYPLDPTRDVGRLVFMASSPPLVCDIAAMRGGTIDSDLRARDFTANALAIRWEGGGVAQLVDLVGGQADVERRLLRRVTPVSLAEDSIRLLRAVRFAVQLDFTLEEETSKQILRMSDTVKLASPERVRDELWKMMVSAAPDRAIEMLAAYGLLRPLLPEIADMEGVEQSAPHVMDVYQHTLQTVRYALEIRRWLKGGELAEDGARLVLWRQALSPWLYRLREHFMQSLASDHLRVDWLVWHALWHDVGKPTTRTAEKVADGVRYRFLGHETAGTALMTTRLDALRFSRQEISLAQVVVDAHMRPHLLDASFGEAPISRRALYRFFRDTGGRQLDTLPGVDVVMLALADYQAIFGEDVPPNWDGYLRHAAQLLEFAFSDQGMEQSRRPLVDGHTVMEYFSLTPGRQVGELLERLQEAQAAGEIATREDALALAAEWVTELEG